MAFVLDASATLPWCFQDETTEASESLLLRMSLGEEAVVPSHWPTEVLSSLLRGKRRGRITDVAISRFLDEINGFRITIASGLAIGDLRRLKTMAERNGLSGYDAAYLDLAARMGLELATFDAALVRACAAEGVRSLL